METKKLTIGFALAGIILILIAAGAFAQPSVYDVAGTAKLNGNSVTPGTLIVAKDANGTERGNFTVTLSGFYGIMHVNGDDPNSTWDVISFFINGVEADQTLIWQPFGYDPNFFLTACDLSTYSITVHTDSALYYPGQNMAITGWLMNSQCNLEPGKTVAYSVPSTPIMGQIATNGSGYFSVAVTIPNDMTLGNYTLWASYPPGANETVFSTANFTVTIDKDGDGYNFTVDCNDNNPAIHPGAAETCGNGIDENCNPSDDSCLLAVTTTTGGGGGGGCSPSWTCTAFGSCQPSGIQARNCTDSNNCGTSFGKPNETQACAYTPPAGGECTPGSRMCSDKDLMECSSEGKFVTIQTCEFGCSGNACNEKPAETGPSGNETGPEGGAPVTGFFLLEPSAWPYWILIAIIIIIIVWYLMGRKKKKKASVQMS